MSHDDGGPIGSFATLYGRILQQLTDSLGERAARYDSPDRSMREEVVRCIWFGGHFPADGLRLDDGRRLEVVSPGWWNVEGGPDFARAEVLIEGRGRVVGDVEVHTSASGWYAHGHHRQPEYADVALHVVMWNDRPEATVRAADGTDIPQFTLSSAVEEDLEELVDVLDADDAPDPAEWPAVADRFCGEALRSGEVSAEWLGRLLDAAGDHRILTRAQTVGTLLQGRAREQVLYEQVAEALGYKNNRMPFLQLAGLLPLTRLRELVPADAGADERAARLEAAMFAVSGLLPVEGADNLPDLETATYVEELRDRAAGLAEALPGGHMSARHWQMGGTRPVNFPTRRLAGLARLYAEHLHGGLFSHLLRLLRSARATHGGRASTAERRAVTGAFTELSHPYWSFHYTFGGRRLASARGLVGQSRATAILMDVLLPLLLAHAQAEGDTALAATLHRVWRGLPRRPRNAVTRRMEQVMFESEAAAKDVVTSARRQQGLHQLYRDGCRGRSGCEGCVVYQAHRAGLELTEV